MSSRATTDRPVPSSNPTPKPKPKPKPKPNPSPSPKPDPKPLAPSQAGTIFDYEPASNTYGVELQEGGEALPVLAANVLPPD